MNISENQERREHFRNALSNYIGVLDLHNTDLERRLIEGDKNFEFPEKPADVLDYLGFIEPLEMTEVEKQTARYSITDQIDRYGAKEVWEFRLRFKLEWYYCERVL